MTGRVKSARCLTDFPKNLWKGLQDISCDSRGWTRWPRTSSLLQCSQTCPMFIHAQSRGWPSRSFLSMYVYICGHALTRLQLASYPWLGNFGRRPALRFLCFFSGSYIQAEAAKRIVSLSANVVFESCWRTEWSRSGLQCSRSFI